MKTTIIQIGNSDNKLTQFEWSNFILGIDSIISQSKFHFRGGSSIDSPFQNFCWVIEGELFVNEISQITNLREKYNQDSVAITEGETKFI